MAFPTETVYALAANPFKKDAIKKLYGLKGRNYHTPLALLVDSMDMAEEWVEISPVVRGLMERYCPGPLTLILPRKPKKPIHVLPEGDVPALGIRIPAHPTALEIVRAFALPVAATSVNRSGEKEANTAEAVKALFGKQLGAIVDKGPMPVGLASTVVDMTVAPFHIIRQGAITEQMLLEVLS